MIAGLRKLNPYHRDWTDPEAVQRIRDAILDSLNGESRNTTPQQDAKLRQEGVNPTHGPNSQRRGSNQMYGQGGVEQRSHSLKGSDYEYLDGQEGAEQWLKTKKL